MLWPVLTGRSALTRQDERLKTVEEATDVVDIEQRKMGLPMFFPLLVLKGIYHYWTYLLFFQGTKKTQMEVALADVVDPKGRLRSHVSPVHRPPNLFLLGRFPTWFPQEMSRRPFLPDRILELVDEL